MAGPSDESCAHINGVLYRQYWTSKPIAEESFSILDILFLPLCPVRRQEFHPCLKNRIANEGNSALEAEVSFELMDER
jgi:hypothetical protein